MITKSDRISVVQRCHAAVLCSVILSLIGSVTSRSAFAGPLPSFWVLPVVSELVISVDSDSDGQDDAVDNCPNVFNPSQTDLDMNGIGDACEPSSILILSAGGGLLYDVNFSTPPHIVGQPPVVGQGPAPRDRPTMNPFGQPLVLAAVGALTNQPVVFDKFGNTLTLEQTLFGIGPLSGGFAERFPTYHLEMNILVEALSPGNDFRIFVDAPNGHSVRFRPGGEIAAVLLGPTVDVPIGTYTLGVPLFLEIDLDISTNQWAISADGLLLFASNFPSTGLNTVRLGSRRFSGNDLIVGVDDIRITSSITGACCNESAGVCAEATHTTCLNPGDRFGGAGSTCATLNPPCPPPPPPICGDNVVNQTSEVCDGTDTAACPLGCAADCTCGAIPTVSAWGLLILTLLLMTGSKIYFNRRRLNQAPR